MRSLFIFALASSPLAASPALADAAAGKAIFQSKCTICHSVSEGQNKVGPSLWNVVGRKAGTAPAYHYSPAMAQYGKVWDEATLDPYLTHPREVVPGTKMAFGGLPDAGDRASVIAYMATLK